MEGVDYCFHLAAMISVPESVEKIGECVDLNVNGLLVVLEEAAAAGVKKLCFSTSAAIYGTNPVVPKRESMYPEPLSPYAITKLDGEYYCNLFTATGRLQTACLRYFNVFGPRQDPRSAYAAAVPIFTAKAVANEPITIYGDGEQTRDFIYVKDIVAANVFMAEHDFTGVYNIAYGGKITINDLVKLIKEVTNSSSEVIYMPERAGDVKHSMAATDKLLATGFKPRYDFASGMKATVEYFSSKASK
jgi:UDP-glucose 4-epimerase